MIVRIFIAGFASFVSGLSYLSGLTRLMTAMLVGFGALSAIFFGVLFVLPVDQDRLLFPIYDKVPAWPYFVLGAVLCTMVVALFLFRAKPAVSEEVSSLHFKYLLGGIGGYLISLFGSSMYWFPSDEKRLSVDVAGLSDEVLIGTIIFLIGISGSCYLFYKASKGNSEQNPDLMRRFVLALFTFIQLDKVPLLVAYLLIYAPDTGIIFPNVAALALSAYLPVAAFLIKTTWDSTDNGA
ncbi:MAG: hypothetical protein COA36_09420 [Desulfotalea sp.]|nr:MAG: hypothetical protein COA36_09420 [Desulfotalea sp.]